MHTYTKVYTNTHEQVHKKSDEPSTQISKTQLHIKNASSPGLGGGIPGGIPGIPPAGPPLPAPYCMGGADTAAPLPPAGVIAFDDGPPTPRPGPARPAGACAAMGAGGIPRPAARAAPGPPTAADCVGRRWSSAAGGLSTWRETTTSPRRRQRPSMRFSSRSSVAAG